MSASSSGLTASGAPYAFVAHLKQLPGRRGERMGKDVAGEGKGRKEGARRRRVEDHAPRRGGPGKTGAGRLGPCVGAGDYFYLEEPSVSLPPEKRSNIIRPATTIFCDL